jgi:mannose-6-phosphate isomerase-like protein (cupin superfamily)
MKIQKRSDSEPFITLDGSTIREIVHPDTSRSIGQSLAEASLDPGQATLEHRHIKSEEIYYIISGKGLMHLGSEVANMKKNDAVVIPPGTSHYIENCGNVELVLLCCSSPAYSDDDTMVNEQPKIQHTFRL